MSAVWRIARGNEGAADLFEHYKEQGFVAYLLWGNQMTDSSKMLGHLAGAMQFPYYFGGNWHAFDESFGEKLESEHKMAIVILDGEEVGIDEEQSLRDLATSLNYASDDVQKLSDQSRLEVVVAISEVQPQRRRWIQAGAIFTLEGEVESDG